jgi:hypothetical protein
LSFSTSLLSVSTNTANGDRGASFSRAGREDENGRAPIRADDDEPADEGWNRGRGDDVDEEGRDDLADVESRWFTWRGRERRMVGERIWAGAVDGWEWFGVSSMRCRLGGKLEKRGSAGLPQQEPIMQTLLQQGF